MNIDDLKLFVSVASHGNFSLAARDKNLDPSSVSRSIAGLESELGFRLFQRTTRKLALTDSGRNYLSRLSPVLEELDMAREDVLAQNSSPAGTLRMTAPVSFGQACLLPVTEAFQNEYPDIRLEYKFTDQVLDLVENNIDLACRMVAQGSDLVSVKLFTTRYHVCASPCYLKKSSPLTQPQMLSKHKSLVFDLPRFRSRWIFKAQDGGQEEVTVNSNIMISSALALREACLDGLGPCLLPDWLVREDVKSGRLIDVFSNYHVTATSFDTAVWLLYPSRKYLPTKTRVMIDFLKRKFKSDM